MGQTQSDADEQVEMSQIQELYKKFASECPSGNLHLHEFKKIFGVTSESSAEECAYMENLFRSFDANKDNTIDFLEYVAAVHLVLRGKLEDKLKWTFKVYDRDGNGRLDKREVRHIIRAKANLLQGSKVSWIEQLIRAQTGEKPNKCIVHQPASEAVRDTVALGILFAKLRSKMVKLKVNLSHLTKYATEYSITLM